MNDTFPTADTSQPAAQPEQVTLQVVVSVILHQAQVKAALNTGLNRLQQSCACALTSSVLHSLSDGPVHFRVPGSKPAAELSSTRIALKSLSSCLHMSYAALQRQDAF